MIITGIALVVFCFIAWCAVMDIRDKQFREKIEVGHMCSFYIEDERVHGRIIEIRRSLVFIEFASVIYKRPKNEIYRPVL